MGKRGPAPTPTAILLKKGSWRGKVNKDEPKPKSEKPKRPEWIDKYANSAWQALVPKLVELGVVTKLDRNLLTRYCQTWSRWRQAEEHIQKHGDVITLYQEDEKGNKMVVDIKDNPKLKIAKTLSDQLLKMEVQLGLTPSARSRITVLEKPQEKVKVSDKARFLKLG